MHCSLRREPSPALVRSQSESAKAQPEDDLDYLEAVRLLSEDAHGRDLLSLSRSDIEVFLADQLDRHRPSTW
jgi:hypothetical protein